MKTITLLLAATGALFLSSCTCTKSGSCCAAGAAPAKACCKEAAAKGAACKTCETTKAHSTKEHAKKAL